MVNPTIAADGHTYESTAIQCWLKRHNTSPVTGQPLHHRHTFANHVMHAVVMAARGASVQSKDQGSLQRSDLAQLPSDKAS